MKPGNRQGMQGANSCGRHARKMRRGYKNKPRAAGFFLYPANHEEGKKWTEDTLRLNP